MNDKLKVIHTGDVHLGMTFKSLGDQSRMHRRDCQDVFSNVVQLCIEEKADAFLIAGDLFDKPNPPKALVSFVIGEFEKLEKKKIPVFIVQGNHDPYTKDSVWATYNFPSNVHIFDRNKIEAKSTGKLTCYGIAYTDDKTEPLKGFKAEESDDFRVGLVHGSTTDIKAADEPEYSYRPIHKEQINNSNLHYVALGHFHDVLEERTKVKCFYSGCPEGLSFKNRADTSVLLVEFSKGKVDVKPIRTAKREFIKKEIDCTKFENDEPVRKLLKENQGDNNILKLTLKGSPELDFQFDKDLLQKEFEGGYFFLRIDDQIHIPENLNEDETIRGHYIKLMRQEIKDEKDPGRKRLLENALRTGIGYLDNKL